MNTNGEEVMFQYKVQTPGLYNYSHLNKPVEFSEEFLKNLKTSHKIVLEDEHDGPEIGEIEGVYYDNGALFIQTPDELDMQGKGFSTVIKDWTLEDKGDRFVITDGILERVARTSNPKDVTTVLYNSNEGDTSSNSGGITNNIPGNRGDKVSEEVRKLEQEIGGYKNQLNSRINENLKLKDRIKELEKELQSKDTELKEKDKVIGEKEKKLEKYYQKQKEKQEALARELAGDDEDLFETYKDIKLSKLEVIREKQKVQTNTGFQGTGDNTANDQDNGENPPEKDKPLSYEEWKAQQPNSW